MDYEKVINSIITELDVTSEIGQRNAYRKCIEYAEEHFYMLPDYNVFVAEAANTLGQRPIVRDWARRAIDETGDERIHLTYSDGDGPELTGNQAGLVYLSKLIYKMSQAKQEGDHIHLRYGEQPLFGNSFPLNIYFESDEWFEKHAKDDEPTDESGDSNNFNFREIDYQNIEAFMVITECPPQLLMSENKIYKVVSIEKYENQEVWSKKIGESIDRMYVIEFKRDDGEVQDLALDLDDDSVIFLTTGNLVQLTLGVSD